jgi:hypothetical protein
MPASFRSFTRGVLLIRDVLHPFDGLSVEAFEERDVGHAGGCRRPVPVLFAGRTPHDVARANLHDRTAFALDQAAAGGDDQHLAERVCVPGRWQISTDGGINARWIKPDEIVYLKTGRMTAVSVKTEPAFTVGTPEVLFEHNIDGYDVARDGRIVISEGADPSQASGQMNVVINWFEDVKSRMQ